jgi:hypothetical protein
MWLQIRQSSGDPSAVAPPVPIPNTEVKRCSPDDSASIGCAKVGRCQYLRPISWKQEMGLFIFRWERTGCGGSQVAALFRPVPGCAPAEIVEPIPTHENAGCDSKGDRGRR